MRSTTALFAVFALGGALAATRSTAQEPPTQAQPYATEAQPYVYQTHAGGAPMSLTVAYDTGYGTRDSRNLVQQGVEQALSVRLQPLDALAVELMGGVAVDPSSGLLVGQAAGLEVLGRVLRQAAHGIDLDLGVGYRWDYRGDHVPRLRVGLARQLGRWDLSAAGLIEIPVGAAGRDEADAMVALAASCRVTPWYRQGLELAGEDLEGLTGDDAEGGARLLFGPSAVFELPMDFALKLNVAAVYAPAQALVSAGSDDWGFMGRLQVAWTLR